MQTPAPPHTHTYGDVQAHAVSGQGDGHPRLPHEVAHLGVWLPHGGAAEGSGDSRMGARGGEGEGEGIATTAGKPLSPPTRPPATCTCRTSTAHLGNPTDAHRSPLVSKNTYTVRGESGTFWTRQAGGCEQPLVTHVQPHGQQACTGLPGLREPGPHAAATPSHRRTHQKLTEDDAELGPVQKCAPVKHTHTHPGDPTPNQRSTLDSAHADRRQGGANATPNAYCAAHAPDTLLHACGSRGTHHCLLVTPRQSVAFQPRKSIPPPLAGGLLLLRKSCPHGPSTPRPHLLPFPQMNAAQTEHRKTMADRSTDLHKTSYVK
jgi:hypothetical protein